MNRVILGMAAATYLLAVGTIYLGYLSEPTADPLSLGSDAFRYHFPLGLLTALFTLLTHCLVFTYFLGTNRWVKETSAAYSLGSEFTTPSRRCRTRAFAAAMISMLLVVATVASGAGAHTRTWPIMLHRVIPLATYLLMLFFFGIEHQAITEHEELTDRVMDEVRRRRGEVDATPPVEPPR